jgi:hypothetical protein
MISGLFLRTRLVGVGCGMLALRPRLGTLSGTLWRPRWSRLSLMVLRREDDHSVRRGPRADVAIEIDVERRVQLEAIPVDVDHMGLVVAFHIHDPARQQIMTGK